LLLLIGLLGWVSGCGLLQAPNKVVTAVVPGKQSSQPDPLDEQLQLQRYVDDFLARTDQSLNRYTQIVGTESARVEVLRLRLNASSSVISIASGPNPTANLLDLVSVTVLTRKTIEDYWIKTTNGAAFKPWLQVSRVMETNVWALAGRWLTTNQVEELRVGINQWYARTPEMRTAFFARPNEFASMVRTSSQKGSEMNSVFGLVNLDPTAGLDPAVREVTRTRLFAERAMFVMQRMPFLLRTQTELLAYELSEQPSVQLALSNTTRLSESADRMSRAAQDIGQTATQLPDLIKTERKEIMASLEQQEGKLHNLLTDVDRALTSGERMSSSLNMTVTNFDLLMKQFGIGESTNSVPDTNSTPFNIIDYGKTASQVADAAKNLNTLVESVTHSVPQLQQLSQHAGDNVQKAVDHGFRLGLILIVVFLAGAVLAGLLYRFLVERLKSAHPTVRHTADAP
jgi:hypothetical protein